MTKPTKVKCNNCGECCKVLKNNLWVDCPYIVRYFDGHTFCSIYHHRVGAIVGEKINGIYQICDTRDNRKYNIIGCPFNKPDYPMVRKGNKEPMDWY